MSLAHQKLVAWQRADDLFIDVHKLTWQFLPSAEKYELGSQLRRSAYSVPANLVEGCSREHGRDRLRFLNIASASLSETGYGLHAAKRLGYISSQTYEELELRVRQVAAPLNGLIRRERTKLVSQLAVKSAVLVMMVAQLSQRI